MIKLKKVPVFAVCFFLLFTNKKTRANYPSIRPVPCTNYVTGESGICTFNWSCVNVAHGVHIGPCVDRFFVGTCCKIPQKAQQDDGQVQAAQKNGEIPPYSSFFPTLATKTETKKVTFGHSNEVTLSPVDQGDGLLSFDTQSFTPEIVFDYEPQSHHDFSLKTPSAEHSRQPVISAEFLHKLFFSSNTSSDKAFSNKQSSTTSLNVHSLVTDNPVVLTRDTTPGQKFPNKPVLDGSHNGRLPAAIEPTHNLRKPVATHHTHDFRQPVMTNEQHDLRKPVPLSDEHDLRWPVLEEDSHDQRLPVVNLYEWYGIWYLNNHQKPNGSNDFYSVTTHNFDSGKSDATTVVAEILTEPSQTFQQTESINRYSTPVSTSSTPSTLDNTVVHTSSNFTLFIRPTSSESSFGTTPETNEAKPGSTQDFIRHNITQVCGRSRGGSTTARIVGGRKSTYLEWPWMISLRRYEDKIYKHKCGATLLNEFWAITAAHCVDGKLPMDLILRLGEYNFHRADELYPHVERRVFVMVLHPEFDHTTYENDLALLRFNEPVKLKANIVPVCLPHSMDDITGRIAVVTGWGRLSEAGELPASLHEVRMPILSNEECEQMYYEAGYTENIRDVFVCAGLSSGGLDACEGDSGGPMVVRGGEGQWTLVGLISWGMGCAAPKQPGVYTRISRFTNWIEGIISQ